MKIFQRVIYHRGDNIYNNNKDNKYYDQRIETFDEAWSNFGDSIVRKTKRMYGINISNKISGLLSLLSNYCTRSYFYEDGYKYSKLMFLADNTIALITSESDGPILDMFRDFTMACIHYLDIEKEAVQIFNELTGSGITSIPTPNDTIIDWADLN